MNFFNNKAYLFLILFILLSFDRLNAYHIVGGEIEFKTLGNNLYQINLIQYFDEAQDFNPGPENSVTVYIFSNTTKKVVKILDLPFLDQIKVEYTNAKCEIEELKTSKVRWGIKVYLDPFSFADPLGYSIIWERCCRNKRLINIINPLGTGIKYITKIPPLVKNGKLFKNSTPEFKPLNDAYACKDQLFLLPVYGTDPDGDILKYKLTSPLNSSAQTAVSIPTFEPNINVRFDHTKGYSEKEMIVGNPSLTMSENGIISFASANEGLHSFAFLVEEYRNNELISVMRREFQILVVIDCPPIEPPKVGVQIPNNKEFNSQLDTLVYSLTDNKCFNFFVKNISQSGLVNFRAEGVNFEGNVNEIFSSSIKNITNNEDSISIEVCAPACPPLENNLFIVDLIAENDACPQSQSDTLRLKMKVTPPPNRLPTTDLMDFTKILDFNEYFEYEFEANDPDGDSLFVIMSITDDILLEDYGISLIYNNTEKGKLKGKLIWDTDCNKFEFDKHYSFPLKIKIDDKDSCDYINPKDYYIHFKLESYLNNKPKLNLKNIGNNNTISIEPNTPVSIKVELTDADNDELSLELYGKDFTPSVLGVEFENKHGKGSLSTEFKWLPNCSLFYSDTENNLVFYFVSSDYRKCAITIADTFELTINLKSKENSQPYFQKNIGKQTLEVNRPYELEITSFDDDAEDIITLELYNNQNLPPSQSLQFNTKTGSKKVSSILNWQPECSLLAGEESKDIPIIFFARDNSCLNKYDTFKIIFEIKETRNTFNNFVPPNSFTPNNDQINDVFTLTGLENSNSNLPYDNCDDSFEYFSVYTRAGNEVFHSNNRNFKWEGKDLEAGVYFYVIKYTKTTYKNYIYLMK